MNISMKSIAELIRKAMKAGWPIQAFSQTIYLNKGEKTVLDISVCGKELSICTRSNRTFRILTDAELNLFKVLCDEAREYTNLKIAQELFDLNNELSVIVK